MAIKYSNLQLSIQYYALNMNMNRGTQARRPFLDLPQTVEIPARTDPRRPASSIQYDKYAAGSRFPTASSWHAPHIFIDCVDSPISFLPLVLPHNSHNLGLGLQLG